MEESILNKRWLLGTLSHNTDPVVVAAPKEQKIKAACDIFTRAWFAFYMMAILFSCDNLVPVNYDKAGRDLMAFMRDDASLTISQYKDVLSEIGIGMTSKDFFTVLKADRSVSEFIRLLSLDMVNTQMEKYGIDVNNLKRALQE